MTEKVSLWLSALFCYPILNLADTLVREGNWELTSLSSTDIQWVISIWVLEQLREKNFENIAQIVNWRPCLIYNILKGLRILWFKLFHAIREVETPFSITGNSNRPRQIEPDAKSIFGWYILLVNPILKELLLQVIKKPIEDLVWNWTRSILIVIITWPLFTQQVYFAYLGDLNG